MQQKKTLKDDPRVLGQNTAYLNPMISSYIYVLFTTEVDDVGPGILEKDIP